MMWFILLKDWKPMVVDDSSLHVSIPLVLPSLEKKTCWSELVRLCRSFGGTDLGRGNGVAS